MTDAGAQPRWIALAETGLALLSNFRPEAAPPGYRLRRARQAVPRQTGNRGKRIGEYESDAREFEWRLLFVAGMWFQDLFNYDFRRTEMCIIPYGTQMGEISFCAYNTGVGWRNMIEKTEGERDGRGVVPHARSSRGVREESGAAAAGAAGTIVMPEARAKRRLPLAVSR